MLMPYQTKAMVTVQMGDKHVTELRKPYAAFAQLHLSTLNSRASTPCRAPQRLVKRRNDEGWEAHFHT